MTSIEEKLAPILGKKFGHLTIVSFAFNRKKHIYVNCMCDCGNTSRHELSSLKNGHVKSCGCLQKEKASITANTFLTSHHLTGNRIFNIWRGIKARCYNPNRAAYKNYGGRGIKMCEEWKHDATAFYNWALKNGYAPDLSIDRIDNNKGYFPENCCWSTPSKQASNRRCNRYRYNGKSWKATELAAFLNKSTSYIYRNFERVSYE